MKWTEEQNIALKDIVDGHISQSQIDLREFPDGWSTVHNLLLSNHPGLFNHQDMPTPKEIYAYYTHHLSPQPATDFREKRKRGHNDAPDEDEQAQKKIKLTEQLKLTEQPRAQRPCLFGKELPTVDEVVNGAMTELASRGLLTRIGAHKK